MGEAGEKQNINTMTAQVSTGLPKSSGLPLTQNTAPILDFRCLYTHDLRQKKKRWHDGILRFHTFNSRIMVYDVSRNFIGDKYWRETETIHDGDELELEKGVLVQVEEATGRTEQDLAPILNHHKTTQSDRPVANPVRVHAVSTVSTVASTAIQRDSGTLLKPKSLNALLGTPKGKYGRAVLPNKSPFQSHHEAELPSVSVDNVCEQNGRPAKRLKTAKDEVNGLGNKSAGHATPQIIQVSTLQKIKPVQKKGQKAHYDSNGRGIPPPIARPVINLDTDVEATEVAVMQPASSNTKVISNNKSTKTRNIAGKGSSSTSPAGQSSTISQRKGRHKSKKNPQKMPSPSQKAHRQDENSPPKDNSLPAIPEGSPPPYTLRFAVSKPRRKLMHRDLLPDQSLSSKTSAQNTSRSRQNSAMGDNLGTFEQAQQQQVKDRVRRTRPLSYRDVLEDDHFDEHCVLLSKKSQRPMIQNSKKPTCTIDRPKERDKRGGNGDCSLTLEDPFDLNEDNLGFDDDIDIYTYSALEATEALSNATEPTVQIVPVSSHQPNHSRPLCNQPTGSGKSSPPNLLPSEKLLVLSEVQRLSSLRGETNPIPGCASNLSKQSPIRKSHSETNTASTKATVAKQPTLKKQISDTSGTRASGSALDTIRDEALGATAAIIPTVLHEDKITGPWSREAFDLFGWRPGDPKNIRVEQISKIRA